jgi:predicted site-specific integrase-resolvase
MAQLFYSYEELCDELNICSTHIDAWVNRGWIRVIVFRDKLWLDADSTKRFLECHPEKVAEAQRATAVIVNGEHEPKGLVQC